VNIGIFGMDPGGHTGLAWGIFDPSHPEGVAGALRDRMNAGSITVEGDERTQIKEIASIWSSFYSACVRSALLPPNRVWFACEDFILKPGETAGGKDSTSPIAIIWGVEGYRMGREDEWHKHKRGAKSKRPELMLQTAGEAKQYATNARLKDWGLWVVGREHERSAWSHVATFLKRYSIQHGQS
jgi:hypothetical protein